MVTWHGPKMVQDFTSLPLKNERIETGFGKVPLNH
jgi:hypothetical protein